MKDRSDKLLACSVAAPALAIVLYWAYLGIQKLVEWIGSLGAYQPQWWSMIGKFCLNNLSILLVIYTIICLQVAGIAELRFRKNFLKAFLLAIAMTPPLMMTAWGCRELCDTKNNQSK